MTLLAERDLQITLPLGATGRKFDEESSHALTHCMKAVDFIVEFDNKIFYIELKDPEDPTADPGRSVDFLERLKSGKIDTDLKTKYRDSWLYEYAQGRANKPIHYLVLISASSLSEAELLARTDALKRQIPLTGPRGRSWSRPFIAGCAVMNLATWNRHLATMPVERISLRRP